MSVITLEITDTVREALDEAARREHKSPEQVATESLACMLQGQQQLDYLAERAKRGRREVFDRVLDRVPDVPPAANDKL